MRRFHARKELRVDWHELNKKRVADLRELAHEHAPDVTGVTQMKKPELVGILAERMGIEPPKKIVRGIDKTNIKTKIDEHKQKRDAALEAHDHAELKTQRRAIHRLKRRLRRSASLTR
ncbi:MAG: hypothetical protein R6X25_08015 [Candidatus Krumholzibacteriia bacterium]